MAIININVCITFKTQHSAGIDFAWERDRKRLCKYVLVIDKHLNGTLFAHFTAIGAKYCDSH